MQTGVCGTTGRRDDARRVLQRLAGHNIARTQVYFDQLHHSFTRLVGEGVADFIGRWRSGRVRQGKADRLGHARHSVGRKLCTTRARRGTGHALKQVQVFIRHLANSMLANRFKQILNRHVPALEGARQDRTAVQEHRRYVQTHHCHHHSRQRLVTARQTNQTVIAVAAHGQLDGIGDDFARYQRRLHALVTHGNAVGHSNGGKLARCAVSVLDAALDHLGLTRERNVTRGGFVPGCCDANQRLCDLVVTQTHGVQIRTVRCSLRAHRGVTTRQF